MIDYVSEIIAGVIVVNGVTAFLTVHALKIHMRYLRRDLDTNTTDIEKLGKAVVKMQRRRKED